MPNGYYYPMPYAIIPSGEHLTPELIIYFKTVAHEYLEEFIIKKDIYQGHDYITIGATEDELRKLSFSPAYWMHLYNDWVKVGRQRDDMRKLTAQVIEGEETLRGRARAIAGWIYSNVEYKVDTEAPPWELVKPGVTGDCSSFTPLVMTMLGCAGVPCWGWQGVFWGEPHYGHMLTMARLEDGWTTIDPTAPPVMDVDLRNTSAYGYFEIDEIGEAPPIQPPDRKPWWLPTPEVVMKFLPVIVIGLAGTGLILQALKK